MTMHLRLVDPNEGCPHRTDNGRGIVFTCIRPQHEGDQHYLRRAWEGEE